MQYLDIRVRNHQKQYIPQLYKTIPGLELVYPCDTMDVFAAPLRRVSQSIRLVLSELCIEHSEYSAEPLHT